VAIVTDPFRERTGYEPGRQSLLLAWSVAPFRAPRPDATRDDSMTPDPDRTNSTVADLHPWQQPAATGPLVQSTAHNAPVCAKAATMSRSRKSGGPLNVSVFVVGVD